MPKIHATPLPRISALHDSFDPGDFLDCYAVQADMPVRQAAEIITAFPPWARLLVRLRSLLTAPFGLQNGVPEGARDVVGHFPVISQSEDELLAGLDDKHLNFIVSVCRADGWTYLSTWVRPHNFGGRFYLAAIMPFHILIIRSALRRVSRAAAAGGSGLAGRAPGGPAT